MQSTRRGAREYLVKPNDYTKLTKMLQDVAARWIGAAAAAARPVVLEKLAAKGVGV